MPTSPIVQLLMAFAICGVVFATWKGGLPERVGAGVVAANLALGVIVAEALGPYQDMLRFANDGLSAAVLLAITLRYAAAWMGVVMLLYAAQFALHAYYIVTGRAETDYLHALINNINFSAIVWCLIIGTAVAWRRRSLAARA
jgi:hypothetical protein